ncbi:ADP-ribosylation_factor 1 [Hexamita inflata]|uniref:ADP-ribosylation_factor 1 n=1 Tax=Hexamita inflata TaxID=28002 RepID=A0ABP1GLX6_9EUKA
MGSVFSTNKNNFLMVGKYSSGKSSIIKIIAPNYVFPIPIMGFNCDFVKISRTVKLTAFSLYNKNSRNFYKRFCNDITGLIFVLDSSCIDDDVKYYLQIFMDCQEVQHSKILILANKCDLENAKTRDEIFDELNLESYNGKILLQMCSTITKYGISEGIQCGQKDDFSCCYENVTRLCNIHQLIQQIKTIFNVIVVIVTYFDELNIFYNLLLDINNIFCDYCQNIIQNLSTIIL